MPLKLHDIRTSSIQNEASVLLHDGHKTRITVNYPLPNPGDATEDEAARAEAKRILEEAIALL